MSEVTRILSAIDQGDPHAAEQLLPLVYDELRKLAAQKLAQEKPGQTLQAKAPVHEAYLRLVEIEKAQHWTPAARQGSKCVENIDERTESVGQVVPVQVICRDGECNRGT